MNAHSHDDEGSFAARPPRAPRHSELREQIIGLHQLSERRAATASPLGRQLIEMARTGTYDRLAPVIAAADTKWQPESTACDQPSSTDAAGTNDQANEQAARTSLSPDVAAPRSWSRRAVSATSKILQPMKHRLP